MEEPVKPKIWSRFLFSKIYKKKRSKIDEMRQASDQDPLWRIIRPTAMYSWM